MYLIVYSLFFVLMFDLLILKIINLTEYSKYILQSNLNLNPKV